MDSNDLEKMKNISPQALVNFWNRFFKSVLAFFFLGILAFSAYFWYFNVYNYQWSEEEKNNFIKSQSKEVDLKTDVLEKVIRKIGERQEKFDQETFSAKNIFKPY